MRFLCALLVYTVASFSTATAAAPDGMVLIPGGEFLAGTDDERAFPNERPAHRVRVSPFYLDTHSVTNRQFARFVEETGYLTTAEKPVDWELLKLQLPEGTPKPDDESFFEPGSLVFTPPNHAVPLNQVDRWWTWTHGASWRHPEGPGSDIDSRMDHPVVQVSWDDAVAYAEWAGKRLPTEAEWEFAARGGLEQARYPWGDEFMPQEKHMANTFQGSFPHDNTKEDGFAGTAPVGSFPPNGYGLYDMAGNVWNWTADWYSSRWHQEAARKGGVLENPTGPERPFDPTEPRALKRVIKGGSFLCHPSYCESYRPSARRGTSIDTGSAHVGFRLAMDAE